MQPREMSIGATAHSSWEGLLQDTLRKGHSQLGGRSKHAKDPDQPRKAGPLQGKGCGARSNATAPPAPHTQHPSYERDSTMWDTD